MRRALSKLFPGASPLGQLMDTRIISHWSTSPSCTTEAAGSYRRASSSAPPSDGAPPSPRSSPRAISPTSFPRDIYASNDSVTLQKGTVNSPAAIAFRNPVYRTTAGGGLIPLSLRRWIRRRKGPFQAKQRLYSNGMSVRPLLGAESLPKDAADFDKRAAEEGRELTTREQIYRLLLERRAAALAPEAEVRERLAPQEAEVSVSDKRVFAVLEFKGFQFKVHPDDVMYTQRVEDWQVNDIVELNSVMLLGSQLETRVGRPYIPGAQVVCLVEEKVKDSHQLHLRKRKRNNRHKKLIGFRRELVKLRVLEIRGIEERPEGEEEVVVPRRDRGPDPPRPLPKHMRDYLRVSEGIFADPKSFRYIGLKNGRTIELLRRRKEREEKEGGAPEAGAAAGKRTGSSE